MRNQSIRPADLGITRLLWIFAALSLALVAALAVAPARSWFTEWRAVQKRYNALAAAAGLPRVGVAIQQIWKPQLGVVDRCGSCHLAMGAGAEAIAKEKLFAAHPPIPHDPRQLGCTVCHAGQGRSTRADAAHGNVAHWEEPLLEPAYLEAGCGACHSHLRLPAQEQADRGRALVERSACRDCHSVNGVGRGDGPDLSFSGLRGFRADWHLRHLEKSAQAQKGPWVTSFAPLADDEVAAVDEYLRSLVGAPKLMESKQLAHRLGCRGCHRVNGVGGDDGPDLSDVGRKPAADLDFAGVRGDRTLVNWQREHFLDPPRVVPGSQMPDLGLSAEQADLLTLYMLSLRQRPIPEELAPRDRVRGLRLGERDFATDGESLYGVFCAACHGPRGEGRRFGTLRVTFPAIGSPDFLALADDPFLRKTLTDGRPGRRMPAWGTKDGGLRPEEIEALVGYLRTLEPRAPSFDEVMAQPADAEEGRRLYARDCAACHGSKGEGSPVAPPLAAPDNPAVKTDNAVYGTLTTGIAGTAMGSFRRYGARSLRALIAAVRGMAPVEARRTGWAPKPGQAQRGAEIFAKACAGCHGPRGEGTEAPALSNPAFLAAASDGYLAATIVRGRAGTQMHNFGSPSVKFPMLDAGEVADVVAFVRSFAAPAALAQGGKP